MQIDLKEARTYLANRGMDISLSTLNAYVRKGKVKGSKQGQKVFIDHAELDRLLATHEMKRPAPEPGELTARQATEYAAGRGVTIAFSTLVSYCRRGKVPATKRGGGWVIAQDDLDRLVETLLTEGYTTIERTVPEGLLTTQQAAQYLKEKGHAHHLVRLRQKAASGEVVAEKHSGTWAFHKEDLDTYVAKLDEAATLRCTHCGVAEGDQYTEEQAKIACYERPEDAEKLVGRTAIFYPRSSKGRMTTYQCKVCFKGYIPLGFFDDPKRLVIPDGHITIAEAVQFTGMSRQLIHQRVERGEVRRVQLKRNSGKMTEMYGYNRADLEAAKERYDQNRGATPLDKSA